METPRGTTLIVRAIESAHPPLAHFSLPVFTVRALYFYCTHSTEAIKTPGSKCTCTSGIPARELMALQYSAWFGLHIALDNVLN